MKRLLACSSALLAFLLAPSPLPALPPIEATVERLIGGPGSGHRSLLERISGVEAGELFERPYGVAWDGADLLVTDTGAGRVLRIDAKNRATSSPVGMFAGPIGIAACGAGIVVSDSRLGTVTLLDARLRLHRRLASDLLRPTGVACDARGIYVVETGAHRIALFSPGGEPAGFLGARGPDGGQFNFPAALALRSRSLWIGDTLNFRVQKIDATSGAWQASFGRLGDAAGETPRVKGIAVDAEGRVWVSDAHLDNLALFDAAGGLLADLGGPGDDAGRFRFPAGIALRADGRLAVADSLNRRVQVFRFKLPTGAQPGP